ncbi:MAG TPA: ribosome biogenesis GTPase Der [Actinomycetota bacterium]
MDAEDQTDGGSAPFFPEQPEGQLAVVDGPVGMVAVVGRPNVGKSTLVGRLSGRRGPIVGPTPGLTRDRLDVEASWQGTSFVLQDTGGIVEEALGRGGVEGLQGLQALQGRIADQAVGAIGAADVVLFVVDAIVGVTSDELALAERLRRQKAPVVLVANKVDNLAGELEAAELWGLGFGEPYPVSALHGRGSGDLLDRIVELLPDEPARPLTADLPAIALLGRPNVGKSSLFNRLVGEERAIVHADPGTTRDAVDTVIEVDGRRYRLVDTAGIRRRAKTTGLEIPSTGRTRSALARSDVAVLLVDIMEGAGHQEQRIARAIAEAGVGIVLVLNKWDLVEGEAEAKAFARAAVDKLPFIGYAPLVRTSALTGRGAMKLIPKIDEVLEARTLRVPTAELNAFVQQAQQSNPPPRVDQREVRILYATQAETAPPTVVLFTNGTLGAGWLRYLERRMREVYGFVGNPIHFVTRRQERRHGRREEG